MISSDLAPDQVLKNGPPASRSATFCQILILVFAGFHAVKLLAGILPEKYRLDPLPSGLAHAYEVLTGSRQDWSMFETIPSHHAYRARIVITGTDGRQRHIGPLLPGLQPWPEPEQVRIYNLFDRMINGNLGDGLLKTYLQRADRALRHGRHLRPGESWWLEVDEDYTRHLARIVRDGRLFERRTRRFSLQAEQASPANPISR